ncbi:hypothetical protein V5735_08565 (plasmid) [Haladaptatus sp. SPP-AMP-3]|uniref:hypothetical protein n=1 Tax=Haladaptatus sp. SPP-AMP-3 TaxID=3121295 RepID=UPI003C2D4707
MVAPSEIVSALVAVEFVVMASIVLLVGPFEAAISLIPLLLVFLIALLLYRS